MKDDIKSVLVPWLEAIEIVEAQKLSDSTGRIVVRFPVQREYLNPGNTLQGGIQTAMYDVISSWVFVYAKGWPSTGTSRTLTTAYIRPAFENEILLMDCEVSHIIPTSVHLTFISLFMLANEWDYRRAYSSERRMAPSSQHASITSTTWMLIR